MITCVCRVSLLFVYSRSLSSLSVVCFLCWSLSPNTHTGLPLPCLWLGSEDDNEMITIVVYDIVEVVNEWVR